MWRLALTTAFATSSSTTFCRFSHDAGTHDAQPTAPAVEADIWRDTGLRFLGYANEIGEGFRPIVPRLVLPSYGVAVAYVLADTVTKYQAAATARAEAAAEASGTPSPSAVAADTLTWQMFASVLLPGLAINRTVWFTRQAVEAMPSRLPQALPLRAMLQNPMARRWLPTVVGLATIPFIIQPIDHCERAPVMRRGLASLQARHLPSSVLSCLLGIAVVHRQMDRTVRKWLNTPKHFVWE